MFEDRILEYDNSLTITISQVNQNVHKLILILGNISNVLFVMEAKNKYFAVENAVTSAQTSLFY